MIFADTYAGIQLENATNVTIANNTIDEPTAGTTVDPVNPNWGVGAIVLDGSSTADDAVQQHHLAHLTGVAIQVSNASQAGFVSDYNLFQTGIGWTDRNLAGADPGDVDAMDHRDRPRHPFAIRRSGLCIADGRNRPTRVLFGDDQRQRRRFPCDEPTGQRSRRLAVGHRRRQWPAAVADGRLHRRHCILTGDRRRQSGDPDRRRAFAQRRHRRNRRLWRYRQVLAHARCVPHRDRARRRGDTDARQHGFDNLELLQRHRQRQYFCVVERRHHFHHAWRAASSTPAPTHGRSMPRPLRQGPLMSSRSLRHPTPRSSAISASPFSIAPPVHVYYVNASATGGQYTTAGGSNSNNGQSAATPMATLGALLAKYTLDPGDIVYVDAGNYNLTNNIVLPTAIPEPECRGNHHHPGADATRSERDLQSPGHDQRLLRFRIQRRELCDARQPDHRRWRRLASSSTTIPRASGLPSRVLQSPTTPATSTTASATTISQLSGSAVSALGETAAAVTGAIAGTTLTVTSGVFRHPQGGRLHHRHRRHVKSTIQSLSTGTGGIGTYTVSRLADAQ